ncbi:thioesterase II family protein [Nocardia rhizosphaerae]|uniref:Thioesterase TesA n=1 Tax=Nocardia rhizosphaerae TaxID=1691571 RepID=A0ABV8LB43_9NOCA
MTGQRSARWLRVPEGPAAGRRVLVCLPHAGGTAGFFRGLGASLAASHQVVAVQYPGRQDRHRERQIGDIESAADAIAAEIRAIDPGTVELLGHSMGALIGFELARALEADGTTTVTRLTVTNARPPSIAAGRPHLYELADGPFLDRIGALGGTDRGLMDDREARAMYLPALRGDFRAVERYRAPRSATVGCGVSVVAGLRDPLVPAASANGWRAHTRGTFRLHLLDTDHFGVHAGPDRLHAHLEASPR